MAIACSLSAGNSGHSPLLYRPTISLNLHLKLFLVSVFRSGIQYNRGSHESSSRLEASRLDAAECDFLKCFSSSAFPSIYQWSASSPRMHHLLPNAVGQDRFAEVEDFKYRVAPVKSETGSQAARIGDDERRRAMEGAMAALLQGDNNNKAQGHIPGNVVKRGKDSKAEEGEKEEKYGGVTRKVNRGHAVGSIALQEDLGRVVREKLKLAGAEKTSAESILRKAEKLAADSGVNRAWRTGVCQTLNWMRSLSAFKNVEFNRNLKLTGAETSAESIIRKAEKLVADSCVSKRGDGSAVKTLQEKGWLKLLSSVQKSKLIKAEKLKLTLDLLDMMYKSGTRVNAMHICAAITVCVNEKSMNMAEQIVDRARLMGSKSAINAFVYAKLIQGYCSSNQRKEAFALLAAMDAEGVKHDVVIYNTLLDTEQSPEGVDVLWRELETREIQPNERTYCAAIRCYGRAGQLGAVRSLWNKMITTNVAFTIYTYNSFLDAHASVGDVEACKVIIKEMEAKTPIVPRDSYNTLLKAYARCRNADGAVAVLRKMQRRGVRPCLITYNTAMDACVHGGAMLRALGLAKELSLHRLKPDPTTFAILLRSAGLLRDIALVQKVLQDMVAADCGHDEITYRCAVYAFVHCGEGGSALDMLEKMNAAGFTPAMTVPEVLIKSVDAALLRECTAAVPVGRLQQFLADMAESGLSPTRETGGAMVRKLAHSSGVCVALDVAGELRQIGITGLGLYTWQSVIGASAARAATNPLSAGAEVARILDAMDADGTPADRVVYESALKVFVQCGDGQRAVNVYEKMKKAKLLPSKKEDGKDPLERMLLDTMDAALVGVLVANLEEAGQDGLVQGDNDTFDEFPIRTSTATIMQDLADAGIRVKPGAMTNVIRQLCVDDSSSVHNSQRNQALAIRKPTADNSQLQKSSEALTQDRRIQRLERAMQLVETSNCLFGMQVTSFVYGALMEACIRLEQGERVEALWQRMRLEGVKPDVSTWVSRVQALASVGSFKGRIHELLAEAAEDRLEVDSVFLRAMLKACHQEKDKEGVAHIKRMLDTSSRVQPPLAASTNLSTPSAETTVRS